MFKRAAAPAHEYVLDLGAKDKIQAASDGLYRGLHIGAIVQCTPGDQYHQWPHGRKLPLIFFDINDSKNLGTALARVLKFVKPYLLSGDDILFHCKSSFHRAPIGAAMVVHHFSGIRVQARSTDRDERANSQSFGVQPAIK